MSLETFQTAWLGLTTAGPRSKPRVLAWGDGLVDQGLASLWYPCDWAEAGFDELVCLIPSLAGAGEGSTGPSPIIGRELERQDSIARGRSSLLATTDQGEQTDTRLVNAQTAMTHLHRMLQDASQPCPRFAHDAQTAPQLCDVLAASIHSRINGAYVYPAYDCCHELLSTGAWLGHLLNGRAAYMPAFIAGCLADYLPRRLSKNGQSADPCGSLLWSYADICVGGVRLLSIAERVRDTGVARLVRPQVRRDAFYPRNLQDDTLRSILERRAPAALNDGFL
jgi:hypothetical protein